MTEQELAVATMTPTHEGVQRAMAKIAAILPKTPLLPLEVDGATIWCKAEMLQPIGAFKIRGAAVSMPHKETVIPFMDEMDPSAAAIDAVNTIVNTDGYLKAYNTDYTAVVTALAQHGVNKDLSEHRET